MFDIEEINAVIDREVNFIGMKNMESIKGMLRLKMLFNDMEKITQECEEEYHE